MDYRTRKPDSIYRLAYSEEEGRLPWLAMLLDAYALIDEGISTAIKQRIARQETSHEKILACKQGCVICCTAQRDIPVYPHELAGIYWYVTEKVTGTARPLIKAQTADSSVEKPCPFLIDNLCTVYPVRPAACRQFNVFNTPCGTDEDPFHTRRDDVLDPIDEYINAAFYTMLPFYGVTDESDKAQVIKGKLIHTQVKILKACTWAGLIKSIDNYDSNAGIK